MATVLAYVLLGPPMSFGLILTPFQVDIFNFTYLRGCEYSSLCELWRGCGSKQRFAGLSKWNGCRPSECVHGELLVVLYYW